MAILVQVSPRKPEDILTTRPLRSSMDRKTYAEDRLQPTERFSHIWTTLKALRVNEVGTAALSDIPVES